MASPPSIVVITFLVIFCTYSLLLVSATSSSSPTEDQLQNNFHECLTLHLQNSATNEIHTPGNASYASLLLSVANPRPLLSSTSSHKPLLIFTPFHDHEIQAAVHCSRKLDIQIRIRGGGHDFEGLSFTSTWNPFVQVDLRNLRAISIDTEEKTAWVQGGATLGEFYHAIAQKSRTLAFPAGTCPSVGVGGHFSGGGFSMMSRKHGLAADHIIDARVMNGDGEISDRSSMGEDHFWAIRGGGGTSFGIVLAFKVKLVTVPETVTVFNVSRTLEQNATQLVHRWQYVGDKIDDNLLIRVFLTSPIYGKRTMVASFTALFLGRARDLLLLMKEQFPELGLVEEDCTEMSWIESVLFLAGGENQPLDDVLLYRVNDVTQYYKGKSDYVTQPIPVHGLRGIWRFLLEEDGGAELQFTSYGGVMSNFSESQIPFPHRSGNLFMIEYGLHWIPVGEANSTRHMNWMRRLYSYMTPYVSKSPRAAYSNYRDFDIGMNNQTGYTSYDQARVWGYKYFKNNFDRLVRVKTAVDPTNFFRNEQSIPPMMGMPSMAALM